jgi:hypothetical protein
MMKAPKKPTMKSMENSKTDKIADKKQLKQMQDKAKKKGK